MSNTGKKIEDLILNGALEVSGLDLKTGDPLYNFTEKLKDVDSELFDHMNNYFYKEITELWAKGFLSIDLLDDDPKVFITKKAYDDEEVKKQSESVQNSIDQIKRIIDES